MTFGEVIAMLSKDLGGEIGMDVDAVSSIPERLGGKEYRDVHRGGSDHVNV